MTCAQEARQVWWQLLQLRQTCKEASDLEEPASIERESKGIILVVIDKDSDESVLSGTNEDDELIWIHIKSFRSFEVHFPHVPDLQDIYAHKIAVYKIERKNYVFFTYMPI